MISKPLRIVTLVGLLASIGCNGPAFLLPGGELTGESARAPVDWTFAGDHGTAQLETRPKDPYSVNLAFTVMGGRLYVNAGGTETQWVKNMSTDPRVRFRLRGVLYELRAERVTDPEEILAFADAWTSQSIFRRDPRKYEEVWIYRLGAR